MSRLLCTCDHAAGERTATVLFDVGPYGDVWLGNAGRLAIDLSSIDVLFLSHWHWDQSGGLPAVVEAIAATRHSAGRAPLVVDVHPDRPDQRGILTPFDIFAMLPPEPHIEAIEAAGGHVIAHAEVHGVADLFLASGDIRRQRLPLGRAHGGGWVGCRGGIGFRAGGSEPDRAGRFRRRDRWPRRRRAGRSPGRQASDLGAVAGAVGLAVSEAVARARQRPDEIPALWQRIATTSALMAPLGWAAGRFTGAGPVVWGLRRGRSSALSACARRRWRWGRWSARR